MVVMHSYSHVFLWAFDAESENENDNKIQHKTGTNNLTWGIYGMEHNRRDFHRMDDDVQRKRLKRIHCCRDLTNNRKNHPVLAPRLCSTVSLISNTNKDASVKKAYAHAYNKLWVLCTHTRTRTPTRHTRDDTTASQC